MIMMAGISLGLNKQKRNSYCLLHGFKVLLRKKIWGMIELVGRDTQPYASVRSELQRRFVLYSVCFFPYFECVQQ